MQKIGRREGGLSIARWEVPSKEEVMRTAAVRIKEKGRDLRIFQKSILFLCLPLEHLSPL